MNNPYNLPPDRALAVQEGEALMKDMFPTTAPVVRTGAVSPVVRTRTVSPVASPASPPLRRGALQAPNGQYAGYTYFNPINNSASPVIGAYSPYPTMLFAPRMFDGVGWATQLYLNSLRNRPSLAPSFLATIQRPRVSNGTGASRTKPSAPTTQPTAQAPAYNPDTFYEGMVLNPPSFPQSADRAGAGGGGGGGGGVGAGPVNDSTTYWGGLNTGRGARGWVGQGGGLAGTNDVPNVTKGGPGGAASPDAAPRSQQYSQQAPQTQRDEQRKKLQNAWDMLPLAMKFQIFLQTGQWGPQF